ncbi:hypothetical protein [Roseivivax sp. CAU 1753]
MTYAPDSPSSKLARATARDGLPLLLLAAFPLMFWLFLGSVSAAIAALLHFALIALGLALIGAGRGVEIRYHAARAARRPKLPRKLLGAGVLGLSALLLAANHFTTWNMPLLCGALAFGLAVAAFGTDPMRDKGFDDPQVLAEHAAQRTLTKTEAAMDRLVCRVAELQEPDLTLRAEAVRSAILRLVRAHVSHPPDFAAFERPLATFISLAEREVAELETQWQTDSHHAARRFARRIAALSDGFETRARKRRTKTDCDAFALEADLLLDRMRENRAS